MSNILNVTKLCFRYKEILFNEISLDIKRSGLNTLLGPNNCGKTTLINILSGKKIIDNTIKYENVLINKKNINKYRNDVSIIYLDENKKLKFNKLKLLLKYQLRSHGYTIKESNKKISDIIKMFDIKHLINKKIYTMDDVDRKKSLIISAIIYEPKIVFIDDLNDDNGCIIDMLKRIALEFNISIFFTTNNLGMCSQSDNIYLLSDKKIVISGDYKYMCNHDNILSRNGIIIPTMIDLSLKLKDYNLINNIVLDPIRMVDELWK